VRVVLLCCCVDVSSSLFQQAGLTLVHSNLKEPLPEADLYIWDYEPGIDVQRFILTLRNAQHLVLVDSKNLNEVSSIQNLVCVLLKPVSAFTLKTFIDLALRNSKVADEISSAEALRSDRDTLLQYVLEVNLRLQQYDQERNNFLARALHDFRAPLTALRGYCELLLEGKLGSVSKAQENLLKRMCHSANRLTRLTGGTLDMLLEGRFERPLDSHEGNIELTFRRALDDVYLAVHEKDIELDVQMEAPEGTLLFEEEKIQQVIVNLLENSCKFTPKNGTIRVRGCSLCHQDNPERAYDRDGSTYIATWYSIEVSDSGPGVPEVLAEQIFEEYATYSGLADRSGGGLGLAICKAIITAHGGRIWAIPSRVGGKFCFVLPMTHKAETVEQTLQDVSLAPHTQIGIEERI
jgi:signal transduction histidine kinase